jgi:hypothetical protein
MGGKRFIKIYIYPFIGIFFIIFIWYLIPKYFFQLDADYLLFKMLECDSESCLRDFKIFFFLFLTFIYICWVWFAFWLDKSHNDIGIEERFMKFIELYGKVFMLTISIPFIFIILFILFQII